MPISRGGAAHRLFRLPGSARLFRGCLHLRGGRGLRRAKDLSGVAHGRGPVRHIRQHQRIGPDFGITSDIDRPRNAGPGPDIRPGRNDRQLVILPGLRHTKRGVLADLRVIADRAGAEAHARVVPDPHPPPELDGVPQ